MTDDNNNSYKMKILVINMSSQKDKMEIFKNSYNKSNLKNHLEYKRFEAIDGKKVDPSDFLTEPAVKELQEVAKKGKRSHHYQLTPGGIGCFLSHYQLYKNLVEDSEADIYLILEDDVIFGNNVYEGIVYYLENAPSDWDMIYLGVHRKYGDLLEDKNQDFVKPKGFWGTFSYIVNKKGAQKVIDTVQSNRIDGQIDAYLSRMQQKSEINIYALKEPITSSYDIFGTTIQIALDNNTAESYNFGGYYV